MKVLVDGRAFVKTSAGISTFLQGSLSAWAVQCPQDTFYLALPQAPDKTLDGLRFPPNVQWVVSDSLFFKKLPNLVWLLIMMPVLGIRYRADIYFSPLPCIPFCLKKRVKKVIVVHDVVNIEFKDTMAWENKLASWLLFNRSIRKADIIWTNSNYTKVCVEKYFPIRKSNEIFVGCSVNRTLYHQFDVTDDMKETISNRYGISGRFLLFVGSLEPRKNLSFLVSLMPRLWEKTQIPLVVVGAKGWKETGISQIINDPLFPNESIVFCGYVSNQDLAVLYNMATCFVSASLNEGFGMPQLEAFLCGCPVVTADNSAMREVAKGKSGSLLIAGYDDQEWVDQIIRFVDNPPQVRTCEFDHYDWNKLVSVFLRTMIGR